MLIPSVGVYAWYIHSICSVAFESDLQMPPFNEIQYHVNSFAFFKNICSFYVNSTIGIQI
jgi:hypothetical protein